MTTPEKPAARGETPRTDWLWAVLVMGNETTTMREVAEEIRKHAKILERELSAATLRAERDAMDAARYQFLRHDALNTLLDYFGTTDTSDVGLDAAIDTAMLKERS